MCENVHVQYTHIDLSCSLSVLLGVGSTGEGRRRNVEGEGGDCGSGEGARGECGDCGDCGEGVCVGAGETVRK